MTILVVEDNAFVRFVLLELLQGLGSQPWGTSMANRVSPGPGSASRR